MDRNIRGKMSNIEILKLVAIVMVVFSHSMPVIGDRPVIALAYATGKLDTFLCIILRYMGQIGNAIFIMCSAWFLVEDDRVKSKKIFHIAIDCLFFSLVWLLSYVAMGYTPTKKEIIRQLMPITFGNNWFITAYLLMYAIHPMINKAIGMLSKNGLLMASGITIWMYGVMNIGYHVLFQTDGELFFYNDFIGVITVYIMTAYFKKYIYQQQTNKRSGMVMLIVGITGSLLSFIVLNQIGLWKEAYNNRMTSLITFMNPFCLMTSLGLLQMSVVSRQFVSKKINYVSCKSLLIYIIHENYLVYTRVRNDFFRYITDKYNIEEYFIIIIILAVVVFITSFVFATVYSATIGKALHRLCDVEYTGFKKNREVHIGKV